VHFTLCSEFNPLIVVLSIYLFPSEASLCTVLFKPFDHMV